MNKYVQRALSGALILVLGLSPFAAHAASPTPKADSATAELDQAMAEFQAALKRLGATVAKSADENTAETRKKLKGTLSQALREMSASFNETAKKLDASASKKSAKKE